MLRRSCRLNASRILSLPTGIDTKAWVRSEAWQILSPTRAKHFGTYDLNRLVQRGEREDRDCS